MDESLVYRKTRLGAAELAATHGTLSPPARRVLILLDGRRPISELAALLGLEAVERSVSELEAHGYARRVETVGEDPTTLILRTHTGTTVPAHSGLGPRTGPGPGTGTGSGAGTVGLDSEESGSAPRKGRVGWVLLLFATAALGSGFWMFGRAARPSNTAADPPPAALAADPHGPDRGQVALAADSREEPALTPPPQPVRELPLSGLPEVIVKAPGAPAGAQSGARARRPLETAATAEASLPPAALAPPATSTPVVASADQTVASALAISESRPPDPPMVTAATAPADTKAREAKPAPTAPADTRAREAQTAATAPADTRAHELQAAAPQTAPVAPAAPTPAPAVAPEPAQALRTPPGAPATGAGRAPTQLASLAPPQAPASAPVELHARKRVQPEFPARALRSGIREGHVLARIWVTPEGKVDQVDIVSATPARVFDEEVRRALSLWAFDPPGRAANATIELSFTP